MTSLLTNNSAMVALQTLRSINSQLDQTNNRVSTGLRVNTAADNAAYWSISTTIKSDNGALGAVTDSLSLGASTLTTTYNGLNAAITALNDLKDQLTTATGANVDRAKVQQTIEADQAQLYAVAKSSSFSGQNWLYWGDTTTSPPATSSIVSSVSRDSNNDLTIGTIDVGLDAIRLYGNGGAVTGILDQVISIQGYTATGTNPATVESAAVNFTDDTDQVTFNVTRIGGSAKAVTIDQTTLANAGINGTHDLQRRRPRKVLNQALTDAGVAGITGVSRRHTTMWSVSFSR